MRVTGTEAFSSMRLKTSLAVRTNSRTDISMKDVNAEVPRIVGRSLKYRVRLMGVHAVRKIREKHFDRVAM